MVSRGGDAITTIPLRKATRDRLKQLGAKGETYDAILNRLIDRMAPQVEPKALAESPKALVDFEPIDPID
jgi:hypothetical protein